MSHLNDRPAEYNEGVLDAIHQYWLDSNRDIKERSTNTSEIIYESMMPFNPLVTGMDDSAHHNTKKWPLIPTSTRCSLMMSREVELWVN